MSNYVPFLADGKALEIISEWQDKENAARQEAEALKNEVGAKGFWWSAHGLSGFIFDELPEGWKLTKDGRAWPKKNSKARKAVHERMQAIRRPDFDAMMNPTAKSMMIVGNRWFSCGLECFDGQYVILVPKNAEGEPFFIPPDSKQMKLSEYYALKEASEEA